MSRPNPKLAEESAAEAAPRAALMLAALALWLLATMGWRPLMLPDEGRYVGVAWAMLNGDHGLPRLNGLPFFHKPPLMYWVDMAAMAVSGANEFSARAAPALGGWLMGAALYLHLRRRQGARVAAIALGVLATSPFFFIGAQYANHDMLVAGLITAVLACLLRALEDPLRVSLPWLVAAWSAAALAVLAKGLIGVVLPGLVILPWLLAQRRWRALPALLHPAGLLVFALLAAPWFVAMQLQQPGFFDYFVVEQHFRRFAQTSFNNVQPFWFYFAVLPLLTLPWSLWLPTALRQVWRARPEAGRRAGEAALYLWWLFAVLLFFSLPASKLVGYVLPALAPLVALVGLAAARGRAWRFLMPVSALSCLAILAALAIAAPKSHRDVGLALRAALQPGDRVVLVDDPFFDLPFYARLAEPPTVLSNWGDPAIAQQDNWRKELADAARFDPAAGARLLWPLDRATQLLCAPGRVWILVGHDARMPDSLAGAVPVLRGRLSALWRAEGGPRPGCP